MLLSIKNYVLLEQSAAFDTIDHGTILDSFSSWFGVGGVVWNSSSPTSLIVRTVLRLALSCLMQRSSWLQYPYRCKLV